MVHEFHFGQAIGDYKTVLEKEGIRGLLDPMKLINYLVINTNN